jgi:hypothetical protein
MNARNAVAAPTPEDAAIAATLPPEAHKVYRREDREAFRLARRLRIWGAWRWIRGMC